MSIPAKEQASRFLAPLKGTLTVMLLHDTRAKLPTGRLLLGSASAMALRTCVLDTDAYYCANIDRFAALAQSITDDLFLLPDEFEASSLTPLLSSKTQMLVIDDLNALYSLASDGRKIHQLAIMMRLLSHNARLNGSWVVATAYKTEGAKRLEDSNRRSLTSFADLVVDVAVKQGSLHLKAGFKSGWPNDELNV